MSTCLSTSTIVERKGRKIRVFMSDNIESCDTMLFFIHGAGGRALQWKGMIDEALTMYKNKSVGIIAFDNFGHHHSKIPENVKWEDFQTPEYVADALAILTQYAKSRNFIISHSFGTAITTHVLCQMPSELKSRFERVVLMGTCASNPPGSSSFIWYLPEWCFVMMRPIINRSFRSLAYHSSTSDVIVERESALASLNSIYMMKALIRQIQFPTPEEWKKLPSTLILMGETDGVTPIVNAEPLQNLIPRVAFETIPSTSHNLLVEKPKQLMHRIDKFLFQS